jgi:hypothetical protein
MSEERARFDDLLFNRLDHRVRIEQERVGDSRLKRPLRLAPILFT